MWCDCLRTKRAIAGIWAVSVLLPAGFVGVFSWYLSAGPCNLHFCSVPVLLVLTVSYSAPMQVLSTVTIPPMMCVAC